jgi:GDP-L-fucose synthase
MRWNEMRTLIFGGSGLIGSAVARFFQTRGADVFVPSHQECDVSAVNQVSETVNRLQPSLVVMANGRTGGLQENLERPASLFLDNLEQITGSFRALVDTSVRKVIFFGSSCMYPKDAPQPLSESDLFTGLPEKSSLSYAITKMAGVQGCLAMNQQYRGLQFIPVVPNSVFGPGDNFSKTGSHVLAAMVRRMHEAKATHAEEVTIWGSGKPLREFIYCEDLASAVYKLVSQENLPRDRLFNVGSGHELSICDLAYLIADVVGFEGNILTDPGKPDGAGRKLLDSSFVRSLGWEPSPDFRDQIEQTYSWFLNNEVNQC